jgi:hypothetical protein
MRPRSLRFESLSQRIVFCSATSCETWTNSPVAEDINNDGNVTALDALVAINQIAAERYIDENNVLVDPTSIEHPEHFYDVNGDGKATTFDALLVLNYIARESSGNGEILRESMRNPINLQESPKIPEIDANPFRELT